MVCPACQHEMKQVEISPRGKPVFACVNPDCKCFIDVKKWGYEK
ncbi:hypothetical protein EDC14_1004143 [Hydrogenispora ethanolica]|jgi:hypothetical protein|uniref:Uncharacterized protein n=1 Tax=Hydrogenispora ethanolica TaxID=1082276 RepID=A0A4R1S4K5_HYDET|nr:hypothetical protein EDC14_1004143 [Hydrogenispora ethanolica]